LVSENTDLELGDELFRIQDRAVMVINIYKTKELVFLRPRPGRWCLLVSFEGIEQVQSVIHSNFSFVDRVDNALKLCTQRVISLKQVVRDYTCVLFFEANYYTRLTIFSTNPSVMGS